MFSEKVQFFESYIYKRIQFFQSYLFDKEVQFLGSFLSKKEFQFLSHIFQKESSIRWVSLEKWFNSLSHIRKKFNSLSHTSKRVQFFGSYFSKGRVQFFESYFSKGRVQFFESLKRRVQFLWVTLKRRVQFLWVMLKRMVQFCESFLEKKSSILWNVFFFQMFKFNSLSRIRKEGSFLGVILERGSILRVILKRGSILWGVIYLKQNSILSVISFLTKKFNSWVGSKEEVVLVICYTGKQRWWRARWCLLHCSSRANLWRALGVTIRRPLCHSATAAPTWEKRPMEWPRKLLLFGRSHSPRVGRISRWTWAIAWTTCRSVPSSTVRTKTRSTPQWSSPSFAWRFRSSARRAALSARRRALEAGTLPAPLLFVTQVRNWARLWIWRWTHSPVKLAASTWRAVVWNPSLAWESRSRRVGRVLLQTWATACLWPRFQSSSTALTRIKLSPPLRTVSSRRTLCWRRLRAIRWMNHGSCETATCRSASKVDVFFF